MLSDSMPRVRESAIAQGFSLLRKISFVFIAFLVAVPFATWIAKAADNEIEDITGRYEFLGPHDTLAVLEDAGKLKGYIDVYQGEEESDYLLSYQITLGWRKDGHIEIKTATIHRKYYRFKGTVERGKGRKEGDPDYLRLVGEVEAVTIHGDSGEESAQKTEVVLKSLGQSSEENEEN
jgi:hypothetical protein